jgi:hypothetical protein
MKLRTSTGTVKERVYIQEATPMTPTTDTLLNAIATHEYQPLLHNVTGTMRFDITQSDGNKQVTRVKIDHGKLTLTHDDGPADCTIAGRKEEFDHIIAGPDSLAAAYLRGVVSIQGDPVLAQNVRRVAVGWI